MRRAAPPTLAVPGAVPLVPEKAAAASAGQAPTAAVAPLAETPEAREARFNKARLAATLVAPVAHGGGASFPTPIVSRVPADSAAVEGGADPTRPSAGPDSAAPAATGTSVPAAGATDAATAVPAAPNLNSGNTTASGADAGAPSVAPQPTTPPAGPLAVWQYGQGSGDSVVWDISLEAQSGGEQPNAVVLAQTIPSGWTVVSSDPPVQRIEEDGRLAKWLLVGSAVTSGHFVVVASGATGAASWAQAPGWYSYRDATGGTHVVSMRLHPDNAVGR